MASRFDDSADALTALLEKAGRPAEILEASDGARIVVLPHGARVLGVFPSRGGGNFLWNNAALGRTDSARKLFESSAWCNTGGDRTWIAPESDFFLPQYPDAGVYHQPRSLDPGSYTCTRVGPRLVLSNSLTLHSYRSREDVGLRLTKTIEPLDPASAGAGLPAQGMAVCGYTLRCGLEITGRAPRTPVGIWNLLQLPHGGVMLFGLRTPSEPLADFGSLTPRSWQRRPGS